MLADNEALEAIIVELKRQRLEHMEGPELKDRSDSCNYLHDGTPVPMKLPGTNRMNPAFSIDAWAKHHADTAARHAKLSTLSAVLRMLGVSHEELETGITA